MGVPKPFVVLRTAYMPGHIRRDTLIHYTIVTVAGSCNKEERVDKRRFVEEYFISKAGECGVPRAGEREGHQSWSHGVETEGVGNQKHRVVSLLPK